MFKEVKEMGEFKNFLEMKSVEQANSVDLGRYTFVKYSDTRDCYIFKLRAGK